MCGDAMRKLPTQRSVGTAAPLVPPPYQPGRPVQAKRIAAPAGVQQNRSVQPPAPFLAKTSAAGVQKIPTGRTQAIQCALSATAATFTPRQIIDDRPQAYRGEIAFSSYESWVWSITNLPANWRTIRVVRGWHTAFENGAEVGHFNITIDGGGQQHVYQNPTTLAFYIG